MLLAFLSTETARMGAGPQLSADEFAVSGGDTADDFGCRKTDVRAVEVGTDTRYLFGYLVFTEAASAQALHASAQE